MLKGNASRKAEKSLYNSNASDYIPLSCHYDDSTLLTKNGELIQILKISGIESNAIAKNLNALRNVVRATLTANLDQDDFACWIHTIRREKNLDDPTQYKRPFSKDLHEMWVQKNSIRNKFVSTLYISIVLRGIGCHLKNLQSLSIWTSSRTAISQHEEKLAIAHKRLKSSVDNILDDLSKYYPTKLCIRHEGDKSYSDPLFVYSRIMHFRDTDVPVPLQDFSQALAVGEYAVGWNQIEMKDGKNQSFSSVLSLREYHNSGDEGIFTNILQLPIEFVATEIFFAIDKKAAQTPYEESHYILGVSKDEELKRSKGLEVIMDPERGRGFCQQQLSIMVIANDVESLESDTKKLSSHLSALGVVNIREDVNLENAFWAQLPGNFIFIRRPVYGVFEDIAAFVSLQNAPTGRKRRKWGRALTILRTLHGTPYFIGFHNADLTGHTSIFGNLGSGKTVFMNFLISESTKHNPTIVYLGVDNKSKLFINALGGSWFDTPILPIKFDEDSLGVEILVDIISGQYSHSLENEEKTLLKNLMEIIQKCSSYDDTINAIAKFDFSKAAVLGESILSIVQGLKENKITISPNDVVGINLEKLNGRDKNATIIISVDDFKKISDDVKGLFVKFLNYTNCFKQEIPLPPPAPKKVISALEKKFFQARGVLATTEKQLATAKEKAKDAELIKGLETRVIELSKAVEIAEAAFNDEQKSRSAVGGGKTCKRKYVSKRKRLHKYRTIKYHKTYKK